ncbi:MAG TPA: isochorismatase family protein [Sphingomonas sp.]|nr:isochorismatase family protein [Sphingomonas sp.]
MKHVLGLDIPQTLADVCDPQRLALVVYDMQVGILRQIKEPNQIVGKVCQVLAAARAAGVRVFFMRHMSLPKELMGAFGYRMAMAGNASTIPKPSRPGSSGIRRLRHHA